MPGRPRTAPKPKKSHSIRPGDYVQPITFVEGQDMTSVMTPCQVTSVYQNGNIHCVSDNSSVSHHGPAEGYRKVPKAKKGKSK
ncbi:hypothetical protein AU099_gp59 [Gordonia phage GTE8]|uniref:Uncharacterized protein n=1 Tax=Gordonia phage GTE8 TaxID=1647475 RepID=A0A0K0N6Q1_9CAUD|nr:hypothetical protein AU099_gp59 [Gordonia phage GTE8]AKJ72402.1 hypothetical protein GTE8_59 [Gordonia phage GTE8]